MARSKHNRARAGIAPQQNTCHTKHAHCNCFLCATDQTLVGKNSSTPASLGHRNPQDVIHSIEFHWKVLSTEVKHFLLASPSQLHLQKFVDFWSEPHRIEIARGSSASSVSGSSWFLALNYLFLDKLLEAQALILHGSFMHECAHMRMKDLTTVFKAMGNGVIDKELPVYHAAILATATKQSMESFLHKMMSSEYMRRMSFACQTGQVVGDYVNFISNNWNNATSFSAEVTRNKDKGDDNTMIEVVLLNLDTNEEITLPVRNSAKLRSVLNGYADERGLSLRSQRFTHAGSVMFLSTAGNKTAPQLGIMHRDTIMISSTTSSTVASTSSEYLSKIGPKKWALRANKKSKGKVRRKKTTTSPDRRKKSTTSPAATATDNHEQDRMQHSKELSRVFDEAQSILKSIRQRLNSLNMERTPPKHRWSSQKTSEAKVVPIWNPPMTGVGGKAGKTHFIVQVGEPCNLYRTTKRPTRPLQKEKPIVADLHGLSKEEALRKLDSSLPQWTDIAMKGSYPFVVSVKIVCGGGNQVLSEVVKNWVQLNSHVANAPKKLGA